VLRVGPPIYVTLEADLSAASAQNSVCDLPQCNRDSLGLRRFRDRSRGNGPPGEIVGLAARASSTTYIASGAANWLDDYLQWTNAPFLHAQNDRCCRRSNFFYNFYLYLFCLRRM
jgi:hypothetical protein